MKCSVWGAHAHACWFRLSSETNFEIFLHPAQLERSKKTRKIQDRFSPFSGAAGFGFDFVADFFRVRGRF
jgi:hypothetical protein